MKLIFPSILILLAITSFVIFTNPTYQDSLTLKDQVSSRNDALTNSRKLQEQRDALGVKYRSISADSIDRLGKMLPDNADNIRLIIDIQRMASVYGMSLSSIKFDASEVDPTKAGTAASTASAIAGATKPYGIFNLEFTTTASYANFLKLTKDIESSLRLTDIESVDFSTDSNVGSGSGGKDGYTYTVKLRTYWLKV